MLDIHQSYRDPISQPRVCPNAIAVQQISQGCFDPMRDVIELDFIARELRHILFW